MSIKSLLVPSLNQRPRLGKLPVCEGGTFVPRIIHQTYYDANLPPTLAENVARVKSLNPGWEHRFYTDADIVRFISENYPSDFIEYYLRIDAKYGAARADFFRYLLIYKIGGVYLDIKSTALKPLDSVLKDDDRFILSTWETGSRTYEGWGSHYELRGIGGIEYQQWYIVSAPGNPFMRRVIEYVIKNIENYVPSLHGTGKPAVLRVTGPIAYSLAIHSILSKHPHRIVDSQIDLGFQYSVFKTNTHKASFRSHYSNQTHSLIILSRSRRYSNKVFSALQRLHTLTTRIRSRLSYRA